MRNRRSNESLINILEWKCKNILDVYPRCRLFISLLLPTKLESLNHRVREFNNLLLDFSHSYKNINIIDHSKLLVDQNNCLDENMGRYSKADGGPLTTDTLHLGKKGIRVFAATLKSAVFDLNNRVKLNYRSRFDTGQGRYRAAVERGSGHRDGYQPLR